MPTRRQHTLPKDILSDVLLRLPLKSIFRFRSSCKLFSAITSSPSFLHSHALLQSANPKLIFASPDYSAPGLVVVNINGGVFGEDTSTLLTGKGQGITAFPHELWLVASCDGLICLFHSIELTYYVFHPLTMECIAVPPLPPAVPVFFPEHRPLLIAHVCGFYYHNSSGEYRMMAWLGGPHFAVHTVGTKTWREIDNSLYRPPGLNGLTHTVRHNRCLYWVARKYSMKKFDLVREKSAIVVFDIEAEEICQMAFPPEVPSNNDNRNCLINVDESVGLCRVGPGLDIEIWVLEDPDSMEKIWNKKYTIPVHSISSPSDVDLFSVGLRPLNSYPKDGEILLQWDIHDWVKHGCLLYNLRRNTYRIVDVDKLLPSNNCPIFEVFPYPYTASLLSFEYWRELDADKNAFPDLASFKMNERAFLCFSLSDLHLQIS